MMRSSWIVAIFYAVIMSGNAAAQAMSDIVVASDNAAQASALSDLPSSDQRARCAGASELTRQASIRSCGRVIGERISLTDTAHAHYYRASHFEELGDTEHANADFQRAIGVYTQVVRANRTHAGPLYARAVAFARMNEFDRATADYQAAIALSPDWDAPHRSIGYLEFRRGNYQTAIEAFDRAIALDPEDAANFAARCEGLTALQAFGEAESACADALRIGDPANNYAHVAIGYLRFMQDDFAGAFSAFEEAARQDPDRALAFYGRGASAIRLDRVSEGEADIAHARELSQRAVSLYANAGMTTR